VTSTEFFPKGLIVFDFFPIAPRFLFGDLSGKAGVKRIVIKVFEGRDYEGLDYEMDIHAVDDLTRPWSKSFPKNTVLVVKEQEL